MSAPPHVQEEIEENNLNWHKYIVEHIQCGHALVCQGTCLLQTEMLLCHFSVYSESKGCYLGSFNEQTARLNLSSSPDPLANLFLQKGIKWNNCIHYNTHTTISPSSLFLYYRNNVNRYEQILF